MIVWRNGELTNAEGAVSAADRGWLIGEAAFETILVDAGRPAFLSRHVERLAVGARTFQIPLAYAAEEIRTGIAAVAAANAVSGRGACRISLTRSGGARGLAASPDAAPALFISVLPAGAPPSSMRLAFSSRRRLSGAAANAFKCPGNYAENILARAEAAACGADEAVMLNEHGRVACASAANIFLVKDDCVRTPSLSEGALPGIVRAVLLEESARLGVDASEAELAPGDLAAGDVLLTNSIAGVIRSAVDGGGVAGRGSDLALALIAAYEERLRAEFRDGAQ